MLFSEHQKGHHAIETDDSSCSPPTKEFSSTDETGQHSTGGPDAALKDESLAEKFSSELEAARARLSETSQTAPTTDKDCSSVADSATEIHAGAPINARRDLKPATSTVCGSGLPERPSYGHRAGFDAFMTGYIFAHFALTQTPQPLETMYKSQSFNEAMIAGLSSMRNRLGNRNKSVPLILVKSQFCKTSQGHRDNCLKIAELKKHLF